MKVDPDAPQLIIDYVYFCRRFGPLDFGEFIALWHAAVVLQSEMDELCSPPGVVDLIVGDAEAVETVH